MMKQVEQFFCALATVIVLTGCNKAEMDWRGRYVYEHEVGEGVGGISNFIEYDLTITDENCALDIVGVQIDANIICATKFSGNTIVVEFKSYSDGTIQSPLGVTIYDSGSALFSLTKNNASLTTQWRSLMPDGVKKRTGQYFNQTDAL